MKFIPLLSLVALILGSTAVAEDTRVYEMRTYYANDGRLNELHARFRDHTVKLFEKHGMQNIGYWVPVDNKANKLVYVLAHPSREAGENAWKEFLKDPDWLDAFSKSIQKGRLVKKIDKVFMTAADYSPKIKAAKGEKARHFEIRTYTTHDDKLSNLDARFRDHTMGIFKRLGMENVAYWHLMDDQKGAKNTLVYILGYDSPAAQKKAWNLFRVDDEWQKAYKASTADGKIVKRVASENLKPTDYSATQ